MAQPSKSTSDQPVDMAAALKVAVAAAKDAGAIQREAYDREVKVERKGTIDLLTEVDTACETSVVTALKKTFPDHRILAEEGGEMGADAHPCQWVIDPLDGTTNFAHRFPFFCVSIGLEIAGEPTLGVVFAPMLGAAGNGELFVAEKGRGATLNGVPLCVSTVDALVDSMLVTGFAYDVHRARRNNLDHFSDFTRMAQATRRTGSAALDLSYVATGRFDGFWELNLKAWDTIAGRLMVTEAGGQVSRFDGSNHSIYDNEILATNGHIHQPMVDVLAKRRRGGQRGV